MTSRSPARISERPESHTIVGITMSNPRYKRSTRSTRDCPPVTAGWTRGVRVPVVLTVAVEGFFVDGFFRP
jgi:hypothetical protein